MQRSAKAGIFLFMIVFLTFIVPSFQLHGSRSTLSIVSRTKCQRSGLSYLRGGNDERVEGMEDSASSISASRVDEGAGLKVSSQEFLQADDEISTAPCFNFSGVSYPDSDCEITSTRSITKLAFVDRQDEVLSVAELNLRNQRNTVSGFSLFDKQCLVTTGQLYGAGKTELGRHAVEAVRKSPDLRARLLMYNKLNHTQEFGGISLLDGYLNSTYIGIDLVRYAPCSVRFGVFIAFALYSALSKVLENETVTLVAAMLALGLETVGQVLAHFHSRHPGKTFFLHWDEVGMVETSMYEDAFGWSKPHALQDRMERYYWFWQILTPLLATEGVYLYVSGKTQAFALIGLGLSSTSTLPSKCEHVVIGSLTPTYIIEAFQKSCLDDGTALTDLVKIPDKLLKCFGETVYTCTAGLPRLTSEAFEALCGLQQEPLVLDSEEKILNALEVCYSVLKGKIPTTRFHGNVELAEAYLALLTMSLLGQSIDKTASISLSGSTRMLKVLRLVDQFNINIDRPVKATSSVAKYTHTKKQIKLRFSQWSVRATLEMTGIQDIRIPFLSPLLSVAQVLDRGAPLEILLRMVICFSLSVGSLFSQVETWGSRYYFFKDTMIENNVLRINQTQRISFVPAVGSRKIGALSEADFRQMSRSPAHIWRYKMNPTDWMACNKVLIAQSSLIHPGPQSASPDLGFSGLDEEDCWVHFACKFNAAESQIGWATIQGEINKTKPLLAVKRTCLVIVSLHLDGSILEELQRLGCSRLVVTSARNIGGLYVPENMEVVILGPDALKAFVGESNVIAMQTLTDIRRRCDPNLFIGSLHLPLSETILPEQGIISLRKRKHDKSSVQCTGDAQKRREIMQRKE